MVQKIKPSSVLIIGSLLLPCRSAYNVIQHTERQKLETNRGGKKQRKRYGKNPGSKAVQQAKCKASKQKEQKHRKLTAAKQKALKVNCNESVKCCILDQIINRYSVYEHHFHMINAYLLAYSEVGNWKSCYMMS